MNSSTPHYNNNTANLKTDGSHEPHGHSLDHAFSVAIAGYFIFIIISGVTFNFILVHTICCKRRLHTISNYFIVNLAVCDLLTALSTLPFDSEFLIRGYYNHGMVLCALKETAVMFSLPAAIVNLLLLTTERFITILFPFHHEKLFRKRKVILVIILSWTYFLLVAFFPLMYDKNAVQTVDGYCYVNFPMNYIYYQIFFNFLTPLCCVFVMNTLVFRVASKQAHTIRRQRSSVVSRSHSKKRTFAANYKAAKTIMILVGNVFVCWLTYIIIVTSYVFCGLCLPREIVWIGNAVNYTSIAVNPIIYGLLNKRIRNIIFRKYGAIIIRFCNIRQTDWRSQPTSMAAESSYAFVNQNDGKLLTYL